MNWWRRNSVGLVWCTLVAAILLLIALGGCKPGPTTPPPMMPGVPSEWPRTQKPQTPGTLAPGLSRSAQN